MNIDSVPTTGSFQNPLPSGVKTTRKRGMAAVLADSTNTSTTESCCKRACKVRAEHKIHVQQAKCCPRGNPKAAAAARFTMKPDVPPTTTLYRMFHHDKATFSAGLDCITSYMRRNSSMEVQKAIAITLIGTAMLVWGHTITKAAELAADVVGYSSQVVRGWAFAYFTSLSGMFQITPENVTDDDIEAELSSGRGRGLPSSLIFDESFQLDARSFVRSNACKKGEPNLTVADFTAWIERTYGQTVGRETARRWLLTLGFRQLHHQKGVYFDGHDRPDVAEHRKEFLSKLAELDKKTISCDGPPPQLPDGERPIIRVVHDESTYYANCDQTYFWGDDETNVIKQKSLGSSLMVSDFVDETIGFLRDDSSEARVILETSKDGYFNNDMLLKQVKKTVDIFEKVHPEAQGLFLFDNAPSHRKVSDDSLNADRMNVGPGGKQAVMRPTVWNGYIQTMVLPDGQAKGMKLVLQERGVDTTGMKADAMRAKLKTYSDFKNQKTILEEFIERRGHLCIFYPKFHCELSPIERVWCHSKKHTRAYANGSIIRLRQLVPEGLNSVTTERIKKFFRTCRDYERAYREGLQGKAVEEKVKLYKSHRRVNSSDK